MHTDVYHRCLLQGVKKNQTTFPRRHGQNKPARGKKQEGASEEGNVNLEYDNQRAGTTCANSTVSAGKVFCGRHVTRMIHKKLTVVAKLKLQNTENQLRLSQESNNYCHYDSKTLAP